MAEAFGPQRLHLDGRREVKMADKVGFGMVGCGVIAPFHAKGIEETPGAELVAACDPNEAAAKEFCETHNNIPSYTVLEKMLNREDLHAVCICTPSGMHSDQAVAAARARKHVLCEKPLDITLPKIDRMIQVCREEGVKLGGIFQRRTYPTSIQVRDAVQNGLLGRMVLADIYQKFYRSPEYYLSGAWRGTWAMDGGGALMNQGVHGIDLLLWIMGDVKSVVAKADHLVRDIEVEDTAAAIVTFQNGAFGVIEGATSCNPGQEARFELHGEKGTIVLTDAGIRRWAVAKGDKHLAEDEDIAPQEERAHGVADPKAISAEGHITLISDFVDAIQNDREPMVTPESARKPVELILAIYESATTGREVTLPLTY
jgi:UDP-N-acetyl-2-amino-2-deoxyglucuronate dehydrogenase